MTNVGDKLVHACECMYLWDMCRWRYLAIRASFALYLTAQAFVGSV